MSEDSGAMDLHHTHFWRSSAGGDIPVTPTGAEHRSDAGQLYAEVRRRDGLTGVPKEELFPARIGAKGAAGPVVEHVVEITVFTKRSGTLSKSIELIDGKIAANADACSMANGVARRVPIDIGALAAFADLINAFTCRDAYALGRIKEGHPAKVRVVATHKLDGGHDPETIARNQAFLGFDISKPGLALLDTDYKAAPEAVRRRIEAAGDVWPILCQVLPQLALVGRVVRASTSSGLRNRDTGETFPGSGGSHTIIPILDAGDLRRFLYDLFDRMWFAGLGWGMVSGCGSFLERSPIDKYVGTPERLIFEAPPVIKAPLEQAPRLAVAYPGGALDTLSVCPPLTDAERTEAKRLKDAERARLKPEMEARRATWSETHVKRMVAGGMPEAQARAHVARWADTNELSGDFPLVFDDRALGVATVADVIAAPARYVGKTLADPFEGLTYGRNIAIVYQRPDGKLWVYSLAHGETKYTLATPPTPAGVKEEAEPHPSQTAGATPGATTPYGRKALDNACAKIRAVGPGERDAAIGKVALRIGALIGGGEIDEAEALSQLLAAAMLNGGDFAEQKAKIGRAVEIGKQQPKSAPQKATNGPDASEDALAQRFAETYAADMRYVALWGKWLIFDGKVWRRDDTLHAFTRARRICRDAAAQDLARAKTLRSAATVAAVERLARSDPRLVASADQWDRDIWLLNTPGGVVDLRTGAIREAAADDYMTQLAGVSPALDASGQLADACPTFYDFLEEVFPKDDELHRFLQRLCGYALTGSTREHVLAFGHGVGRNGKGTFVAALAHVFGDYHRAAEVETFLVARSERHSQDLARTAGARLVTASEPEDRQRWATARVKKLTGGDPVTARYMRENDFDLQSPIPFVRHRQP